VYTYVGHMGTKTIAIMDDVYELLKLRKLPDESFSEELRRLVKGTGSIMDLAGAWKDMSEEDADTIKRAVRDMRKGTRLEELKKRCA